MLFTKACDGGYTATCSNLSVMYYNGQGVKRDIIKGAAYFTDNPRGCGSFGVYNYYHIGDKQKAVQYLKKSV